MRRFVTFLVFSIVLALGACADGDPDDACENVAIQLPTPPASTIRSYKILVNKDIPSNRIGLILDAASEWVTVSSGAVVFEVTYADFPHDREHLPVPPEGEMWIYTDPNPDKDSKTIGYCSWWTTKGSMLPVKSRIWIQDNLAPRIYYLTALHEIGHGLGLTHQENKSIPAIMYPFITDNGDHPTCDDRQRLCALWGCVPGC